MDMAVLQKNFYLQKQIANQIWPASYSLSAAVLDSYVDRTDDIPVRKWSHSSGFDISLERLCCGE